MQYHSTRFRTFLTESCAFSNNFFVGSLIFEAFCDRRKSKTTLNLRVKARLNYPSRSGVVDLAAPRFVNHFHFNDHDITNTVGVIPDK